jgi:uncharacterized membrane protein (DUF2068 family)
VHKDFTSKYGIRAIAVFELVKGLLGLIVGIVLISLLHKDLAQTAINVLDYLHIDPTGHFAQMFVERASSINESNIVLAIVIAFVYMIVRLVEAYGLWHLRTWAEWFAIISGALYLPFELYKVIQKPSLIHFAILIGNVLLVLYLIYVRGESSYHQKHPDEPVEEVFKKN